MNQFIEFVPVALFVAAYFYTRDIYVATAVLMAGICLQVAWEFVATRRVGRKTQVIFWVAMMFGGATLVFRDAIFLLWKPTVVNWLFCAGLVISQFAGKDNLVKKMLGEQITLPDNVWRNLNLGWALGFFVAGVLNLVVAYNFSLEFWVSYKLIGGVAITLTYMVITMIYLVKGGYLQEEEAEEKPQDTANIK